MKNIFAKAVILSATIGLIPLAALANQQIIGAGSSFIYPAMTQWTKAYHDAGHATINYQSIGSSAGINQLKQKVVDFAATDEPMSQKDRQQLQWTQHPIVSSGIIPIIHLNGINNNQLLLSGTILADIYLGKIKYWDNPRIQKINPKTKLPHTAIISIHRADGSGTTYNFSKYLSQVSPTWKKTVGIGTMLNWPGTYALGANGNAGVATLVKQTPGAIGYVEYTYASMNNLTQAKMKVKQNTAKATIKSIVNCNKSSTATCWPIQATTYIEVDKSNAKYQGIIEFLHWATHNKDMLKQSKKLGYQVNPIHNIDS